MPRKLGVNWLTSTALLGGSGFVAQLLTILGAALLVTIYTPAEVGAAAAFSSVISVAAFVGALRYELAVPLVDDDDRDAAVALALRIGLATAAVVGVVSIAFGDDLAATIDAPSRLVSIRFLVGPAVALLSISNTLTYLVTRERAYGALARSRVANAGAQVGGQVVLAPVGGAVALVLATLGGVVAGGLALGRATLARVQVVVTATPADVRRVAREHRDIPLWSTTSSVCTLLASSLLPVIVAHQYGLKVAGLVALAQRVASVPIRIVGGAFSRTFLGDGAVLAREDPAALVRRIRETIAVLVAGAVVPAAVLAIVAVPVFSLVDPAWRPAGAFVLPLLPFFVGELVVMPLNQTFLIIQGLAVQAGMAAVRAALALGPLLALEARGARPRLALAAYGIGGFVGFAATLVVIDRCASAWAAREGGRRAVAA